MRYIADLHVHSHYSRATSKDLNLESLYRWARIKGINVVGTGDFTHPEWFAELKEKLVPDGRGLYKLKDTPEEEKGFQTTDIAVRFCLTTEISSIYKHGDRVRKNHNLVYAPDLDTVARLNHKLSAIGNLEADGRPILGLPSRDLLEIVLETSDRAYLIPAHVWTPWFSTLGSKAGYDSIKACFRDLSNHIFALETGLSSDPPMNRLLSALDRFTLISNSDAHSPSKLGREANLLDTERSYDAMFEAFKTGEGFQGTYEFYPEEGKYHSDGHRKCDIALDPDVTIACDNTCPVCGKTLTIGVLHRVKKLADRQRHEPKSGEGFNYLIPLPEVLSEIEGYGPKSKTVQKKYRSVISTFGNEFDLLHQIPEEEIHQKGGPVLAEAIRRIRNDNVHRKPGYDGVFGEIKVFKSGEIERIRGQLGFFGSDDFRVEPDRKAAEPETETYRPRQASSIDTASYKLNEQQAKVRNASDGATLVTAGPGTGKTYTLIEWIVNQIETCGTNPEEITAITFTNKAAQELRDRLVRRIGNAGNAVVTGTFHAMAWRWLRDRFPSLKTIHDASTRQATLQMLFPELEESDLAELSESAARYLELDVKPGPSTLKKIQTYRQYLFDNGAIDLSDLIRRFVEEAREDEDWRHSLLSSIKVMAIDELQDINPMQYELIRLLGRGKNFLGIGDPDQAIYGFRGSDVRLFFSFGRTFDAESIALTKNYRSTPEILKAAGRVIQNNTLRSDTRLSPDKSPGKPINVFCASDPFEEADYILDRIKNYVGGVDSLSGGKHTNSEYSYGFGDIAVLFRTNTLGDALFSSFLKAGIPVHFGDGTNFLSTPPFDLIVTSLKLLDRPSDPALISDFLSGAYNWNSGQISKLLQIIGERSASLFEDSMAGLPPALLNDLENLRILCRHLQNKQSLKARIEQIFEHLLPEDTLTHDQLLKKETLLELSEEANSVQQFLEQMQLNPYTDAGRLKSQAVHLLTFHAAKGLEFPVVFIAGAEEGITPLNRKDADPEEERRLFYVAMTRAEDELQITRSRERFIYGEKQKMQPSGFLNEIPEDLMETSKSDGQDSENKRPESEQLGLF